MELETPTILMIQAVMRTEEAVDSLRGEMTEVRETMMKTLGETDGEEVTNPEEGEASLAKESMSYNVI